MAGDSGNDFQGLILIDGATGYLGSHLTHQLISEGKKVRCLVRKGARAADIETLIKMGAEIRTGDLDAADEKESREFFKDVACAVHLIGSIAPRRNETFTGLHQTMSRRFVANARHENVQKIVHVTALGTREDAPSEYHRSKWLAEEEVRGSGIPFTILRPSLLLGKLVGHRDSKLVSRLINVIENKPFVPLVNGGKNKIQPLFIKDLVEAMSKCISHDYKNETMELGGSTVLSMRRFVEALEEIVGKRKPIINLHPGAGKLLASAMEMVQEVPTLSKDQVTLSTSDNICHDNRLPNLLGREGSSLDVALATYRGNV